LPAFARIRYVSPSAGLSSIGRRRYSVEAFRSASIERSGKLLVLRKSSIHLFTRCYNDAQMLPHFFRHYDPIVSRYLVYDDGSTDASLSILNDHPLVEIREMPPLSQPDSRIASQADLQAHHWKESRGIADWVIVTDIDEFIHHVDLPGYIARCRAAGVTIIPALGCQMVAPTLPAADAPLTERVRTGAIHPKYNKMNIFDPGAVDEANFIMGRHSARPSGRIVRPASDELLLLHYKHLDFARLMDRHRLYQERQRPRDIQKSWGKQYSADCDQLRASWEALEAEAIDVLDPSAWPAEPSTSNRW
jgi:hypothetical protein